MDTDLKNNVSFERPGSVFRFTRYEYALPSRRMRYPCFKLRVGAMAFYSTLQEAEERVCADGKFYRDVYSSRTEKSCCEPYAYVITELPLGIDVRADMMGESLSDRVYLPDGRLWGARNYANFIPGPFACPDDYNYWGHLNRFYGRPSSEVRFHPGDIVEVFGFPGNWYWSDDEVNLAVIVKCPPTTDEVSEFLSDYQSTHQGFDVCEHHLSTLMGYRQDTYEVLSHACDGIDHVSTIAALPLSLPISKRRENMLHSLYEQYKSV